MKQLSWNMKVYKYRGDFEGDLKLLGLLGIEIK